MCERVCRYTREAGVRSLERKIGAICRAVAVKVAEGHKVSRAESPTEQHAGKTGTFFILHIIVVYGWNYTSSPGSASVVESGLMAIAFGQR